MHKTVFEAISALHLMPPRLVHAGGTAISSFREEGHRCARPGSRRIRRYAKRMTASSSLLLGGLLLAPLPSRAETISFDEMLRGVTVTKQHCAGTPDTVWVTPFGQGVCMRYYFSDAGGRGTRAVVYVPGDKPGIVLGSSKYGDPKFAKDSDITSYCGTRKRSLRRPRCLPFILPEWVLTDHLAATETARRNWHSRRRTSPWTRSSDAMASTGSTSSASQGARP